MIMKKILLSVVCLVMVGMQSVNAEPVILALHHEGNVTFYYDYQFDAAQEAAVEGDTIYLSEGNCVANLRIKKPIHIIGGGETTVINGNLFISIPGSPSLEGYLVENLYVNGSIEVRDLEGGINIASLKLRKVKANNFHSYHSLPDAYFVNCFFKSISFECMENCSIVGSKIADISSGASAANAVQVINCNVSHWAGGKTASYINCIIYGEWHSGIADYCLCAIYNI